MIGKNLIILMVFCVFSSCALNLPERSIKKKKKKTHIQRLKECIDDFMTEQGVNIEDAFEVCEKIHRR